MNPSKMYSALADDTRIRILFLLTRTGKRVCGCEMVDALELPPYKLSRHLKILEHAGLVGEYKEGRWVYFSIFPDKDPYLQSLYSTVKLLSTQRIQQLAIDEKELKKRLQMRKNGKCCLGIQKERLNPRSGKCCFTTAPPLERKKK